MKKVIIAVLVMVTLALSVAQIAAATTLEDQICEIATQNAKVTEAKCIVYECCCIIAIKTEKFTTKSQYDNYLEDITNTIKEKFDVEHVFVTRNPKVMKQIENLSTLNEDERDDAIKQLIEDVLHRGNPRDKYVFPKKTGLVL